MKLTVALKHVIARTRRLVVDDGQDLLEYALLVALIALVAIGAVSTVGQTVYSVFWKSIEAASF
jgi:Flp pilus assembly pilin Flp